MIRILIVDDHDLVREGIRTMLEQEPGFEVVGEVGDGQEAIRRVRELTPDVVLMDVALPGGIGGLEATEAILSERPATRVIILTQYEQGEYIRRALKIGAQGYLLKRSASSQLKEAIRTVARGERYLHPVAAEELVELVTSGRSLDLEDYESLTQRERQVLKLLAEGKTSRDIAKYLGVSLKTAMTHRSNLMAKLGMHSRAEVIKFAIRKGIIEA
ncbi:MAG TPA: response regulator transcription factor [Thermoanaerobaculia bacterium]|nr:response regulator transcription factor [Thermoanaerobaculia bacterium]